MSKESLADFTPALQKLFASPEIRFYHDLLFRQTKAFENVFRQNLALLFEKARDGSLGAALPSDLAGLLLHKFEIDLCSLDYKGSTPGLR